MNANYNPGDYWQGVIDVPEFNWQYTFHQIQHESPSRRVADATKRIGFTEECQRRAKGVLFLFACCRQLKLSRSVAITGSYYFHRFYMRRDFIYFPYFEVAATCLFIACKADECRRKLADVVKVCASLAMWGKVTGQISEDSKMYWKWKDIVTNLEELLLEVLCFDVMPNNPYQMSLTVLDIDAEAPQADDPLKQALFVDSTNALETLARLPLLLMFRSQDLCVLGLVIACAKHETTLSKDSLDRIGEVNRDDVWRCYCTALELGKALEPLREPFRVLAEIPRLTKERVYSILGM